MKIAEYKQVSTEIVEEQVFHEAELDESGEIIKEAWTETVQKEKPVMGMIYREMTAEEIAEQEHRRMIADAEEIRRKETEYEASLITDELGNKYENAIVNGKQVLKLVESYDGVLHI